MHEQRVISIIISVLALNNLGTASHRKPAPKNYTSKQKTKLNSHYFGATLLHVDV